MEEKKYEDEKLEAQKRFDTLPDTLKREIQADKNAQLIYSVCQDYSIPEEKIKYVTMLVGEVFLGYIKPEEVAHELTAYFNFDLQKSNFIEIELKQKLFNALKTDLDKIYNPPKLTEEAEKEISPAMIELKEAASPKAGAPRPESFGREVSPTIIKLETEASPISSISASPIQKPTEMSAEKKIDIKVSPLTMGSIKPQVQPVATGTEQQQKVTPLTIGSIPTQSQPTKIDVPTNPKNVIDQAIKEDMPFIIHTKTETVKAATPQFPRESPSLNLRVDPSIIQKSTIIKPIPVHLETTQLVQEKKFQMPVIAGQRIFSNAPISEKPVVFTVAPLKTGQPIEMIPKSIPSITPKIETKPIETRPIVAKTIPTIPQTNQAHIEIKPPQVNAKTESVPMNLQGRPLTEVKIDSTPKKTTAPVFEEIKIPIQQKAIPLQSQPISSLSLKQVSEQKNAVPEPAKIVHYSTFKTEFTPLGSPKKPEPKKDDFINLNTFMRVSGNTVDLRSTTNNLQPTTNDKNGKI